MSIALRQHNGTARTLSHGENSKIKADYVSRPVLRKADGNVQTRIARRRGRSNTVPDTSDARAFDSLACECMPLGMRVHASDVPANKCTICTRSKQTCAPYTSATKITVELAVYVSFNSLMASVVMALENYSSSLAPL